MARSEPPYLPPLGPLLHLAASAAERVLAALAALWAALAWLRSLLRQYRTVANFPGPPAWPLLGNIPNVGLNIETLLERVLPLAAEYGGLGRFWVGPLLHVGLSDPRDMQAVLSSGQHVDKPFLYGLLRPWIGDGLVTSSGDRWRAHRRLIQPAFHSRVLEQFVPVFSRQTDTFLQRLEKHAGGPAFDIADQVRLLALDIICETAMGVDLGVQRDSSSEYVKACKEAEDVLVARALRPWLLPERLFRLSGLGRRMRRAAAVLHGTRNRLVQRRRRELQQLSQACGGRALTLDDLGGKGRLAFLDLLLLSAQDGAPLSDEDIGDEVDTFMAAGHDTSSTVIFFALFLLSQHEDVQAALLAELQARFPAGLDSAHPHPDAHALSDLPLLERVLKETLRLYPPAGVMLRQLGSDVRLASRPDLVVPAGCSVLIGPLWTQRRPDIYPDPDRFDPDRWLPENSRGRHPYAFIPFSAGPRSCIGSRYAMLECKVAVAKAVWRYRLMPDPDPDGAQPRLMWAVTTRCRQPVRLRLLPRDRARDVRTLPGL